LGKTTFLVINREVLFGRLLNAFQENMVLKERQKN